MPHRQPRLRHPPLVLVRAVASEALPLLAFALLLMIAVARMQQELAPALSGEFIKALALVFLLGARKLLGDVIARADDRDATEEMEFALGAAPAE